MRGILKGSTLAAPALALALACAHAPRLEPAPEATLAPGKHRVAEATAEGISLQVDSSAWKAGRVRDALAPVLVRVQNRGERPLRVAYSDFSLDDGSGFRGQALPPFQVAVQNAEPVEPAYAWTGFSIAPWQSRFYRHGLPVWSGGAIFDPTGYAGWGGWPSAMPDRDVLRRALPEGVADPGGQVSGFLYFPDRPRGAAVVFNQALVDARTGEAFGTLRIPFTVR